MLRIWLLHLHYVFTGKFHSGLFNITLFFSSFVLLPFSHNRACGLTHLLRNNLVRISQRCSTEEWIAWYILAHTHKCYCIFLSVNMHTCAHICTRTYACVCAARESANLLSRSMTVHSNLLIHSVARDRRRLVANEISPSLRHQLLLLPSSAFIRCAYYGTCYIALHYGYIRSSASCSVIMSNSQ